MKVNRPGGTVPGNPTPNPAPTPTPTPALESDKSVSEITLKQIILALKAYIDTLVKNNEKREAKYKIA